VILIFYIQVISISKSHTIPLIVYYRIMSDYSCYSNLRKENIFYYLITKQVYV